MLKRLFAKEADIQQIYSKSDVAEILCFSAIADWYKSYRVQLQFK